MSVSLDVLVTPTGDERGEQWIDVPDGWQQGRGVFGGFVLAALVRAMERAISDPSRKLRAMTASIAAPVLAQRSSVTTTILRAGAGLTAATASLSQDGAVCAHAIGTFAKDRAVDFEGWQRLEAPAFGDWRAADLIPVGPPLGPVFAPHFEFRPVSGFPFSGGAPVAEGWVRAKDPGEARDGAYIAALVDAWWPCALVASSGPRPMATIAFSLEIVGDFVGLDPDAPLYHRAHSAACAGGYAIETRELWGHDGRLVAVNHQTFAIIK